MNNNIIFEHRSLIRTTVEEIMAFHDDRTVLSKLTPPPIFMRLLRDERTSLSSGELEFQLWFGPIPIHWIARHETGPTPSSFADRMIEGPLVFWRHEHIFTPRDGGVELTDRITLQYGSGLKGVFSRLAFGPLPLRMLFVYRHWRTKRAVEH